MQDIWGEISECRKGEKIIPDPYETLTEKFVHVTIALERKSNSS
jgi:hypothetical protein